MRGFSHRSRGDASRPTPGVPTMGKPQTLTLFARKKRQGEKIVVLTAYDLTSATIAAAGGVDAILVGDSLGMVMLGYDSTLPVTIDDMVHHCKAVARAHPGVPIIADMPFGSFHVTPDETVRHAVRLVKEANVAAVKLEGGRRRRAMIEALLNAEIPVMGHLGLTPQSIHRLGGYKVQGRGHGAAAVMLEEAAFLAEIGCFALVLEAIPAELAGRITAAISIATIGIGAGPQCDGQVLVYHDLLGLFTGIKPRFVERYAELGETAIAAIQRFAADVRDGTFPGAQHSYTDPTTATGETPTAGDKTADAPAPTGERDSGRPTTEGYLASLRDEEN